MSKHSSTGSKWNTVREQVLKRDSGICYYCGNEATTVDHILAKANGGKDEMSNLVAACLRCNAQKQDSAIRRLNYVNRKWLNKL